MLQYRKRYELLQHAVPNRGKYTHPSTLQYRKRYELLQLAKFIIDKKCIFLLQYRKRYELLQLDAYARSEKILDVTIPQAV